MSTFKILSLVGVDCEPKQRNNFGVCLVVPGEAKRMQPSVRTGRMEYYGPLMNHAARLAVAAHGGQVLAHESTRKAFLSSGQDNVSLWRIGKHSCALDLPGHLRCLFAGFKLIRL